MQNNWQELLHNAWQRRQTLTEKNTPENTTDSWRVFHGYEEGAKGVTIEKFGAMAIIDYKDDIRDELPAIKEALLALFPFQVIIAKGNQSLGIRLKERMFTLHGTFEEAPQWANEYGLKYSLLPDAIHNCGLYLDARPVRQWLLKNSQDRRILNLFAFVGSLGIAAAKGGATHVTHLDKSKELMPRIASSYAYNDLAFEERNFLQGDIYKHLPRAIKHGQTFDGIILDPPPKVYRSRHSAHKPQGQDFSKLVSLCAKLLNPNGWLICLFHRFDATWDASDAEILKASQNSLVATERFTSEVDFPESDAERKLRVSVFVKPS